MNVLGFALRHPLTILVAVAAIALGSVFSVSRMRTDVFPDLNQPVIYVAQPYGGMDPAQMEGALVVVLTVSPTLAPHLSDEMHSHGAVHTAAICLDDSPELKSEGPAVPSFRGSWLRGTGRLLPLRSGLRRGRTFDLQKRQS